MVPGRKFCTSTSACATSLPSTSRPASLLTSMASERLPRLEEMNSAENSPALSMVARLRRVMSPPVGSILRTSAPWSARNMVANGPETTPVRSSTRTPLSGPGMRYSLSCSCRRSLPDWLALSSGLCDLGGLRQDLFLDVAQLVLAEEHLLADEKRRRTENATTDRVGGEVNQPLLDVVLLSPRDQAVDIDAGGFECRAEDLEIIHLLRLFPHVMIRSSEIRLEHSLELGGHHSAHQHQRVDWKERVLTELRDVVAAPAARNFQCLIFRLVLDAVKRLRGRPVAGRLVDAAEQHRHIFELHASAPLDRGNDELGQVGVGTAEIELKFNLQGIPHHCL